MIHLLLVLCLFALLCKYTYVRTTGDLGFVYTVSHRTLITTTWYFILYMQVEILTMAIK